MVLLNVLILGFLGIFVGRLMALTVNHLPQILFDEKEPRDILTWFFQKPFIWNEKRTQLLEMGMGLIFALSALLFPFNAALFFVLTVNSILMCCFITDYEHGILPDQLTLTLVWIGLLFPIFVTHQEAILGAAFGYGIFWFFNLIYRNFRHMEGMYPGDFKLNAGIGAILGIKTLLPILGISILLLLIVNVVYFLIKNKKADPEFLYKEIPYACSITTVVITVNYSLLIR